MNLKIVRIALNIAIAIFVDQTRADKKCYKPSTPAQLQAAIDETQEPGTFVDGVPNILLLCAGTEVQFKKGDPRITMEGLNPSNNFVVRCESYAMSHGGPCIIDGGGGFEEGDGFKPADNSDRRLYVGNGGFMFITGKTNVNLFFEGLVIKNFAVTGNGGAIVITGNDFSNFYFYKCIFLANQSKNFAGGALLLFGNDDFTFFEFKECNFNLNTCVKGYGGAIAARVGLLKFESCLFKENFARQGGGVVKEGTGDFKMFSVAFISNGAELGGGLFDTDSVCEWRDVDFDGNDAAEYGGAYVRAKGSVGVKMRAFDLNLHKDTAETINLVTGNVNEYNIW